jgi:hypothetical protein
MDTRYEAPELLDLGDAGDITLGGDSWIWADICTYQYGSWDNEM